MNDPLLARLFDLWRLPRTAAAYRRLVAERREGQR